jgi:hypothetical protein
MTANIQRTLVLIEVEFEWLSAHGKTSLCSRHAVSATTDGQTSSGEEFIVRTRSYFVSDLVARFCWRRMLHSTGHSFS